MKFLVIAQHDPNVFPGMHHLARRIVDAGHEAVFISRIEPSNLNASDEKIKFIKLKKISGVGKSMPLIRTNYIELFSCFIRSRPNWIIAQHEYVLPSTLYKLLLGPRSRVAACFVDFHGARRYAKVLKPIAWAIDAYVDVCDMRVEWQKQVWPRLSARTFVARNAPLTQPDIPFEDHQGTPKVVLTASAGMILDIADPGRFSRFAQRLCARGIPLDWYIRADDRVREAARSLCAHPLYRVRDPLPKAQLLEELRHYDVGLFWSPPADCDPTNAQHRSVFISSASNKIGEYIAAGLVVAHTSNPGLSYLPTDLTVALDATDPEAAADDLANAVSDRAALEGRRRAALQYHYDEMNFEAQTDPLMEYMLQSRP